MPDHWQETTLGEAADIKQGETIAVKTLRGGDHPVFGANGIVGWHDRGNIVEDTVALGCRGSCGTVHVATAGSFLANNVMGVRALAGKSTVGFLAVMLELADLRRFGVISGQVQEQITRKSLAPLPVLLPPLEEQRRIVDLVGSIDTYIDSLETQIETTRTARSALLSELLSNPGDNWEETTLGDVADWFAGGTPKATNPAFYTDGQIPWAVIADLLNDPVVETAKQINEDGLDAIGGRLAPVGSILVSMYGTIARTAIAGVPLATNQAIAWAEPHSDTCDGEFLRLLVDRLQPAFESAARGAAQKNINRGMIKDAGVLLPPLAEQHRIVDLVGSFDEQISSLESQVETVRALRSGVLSELLSGERLLDESYDVAVGL